MSPWSLRGSGWSAAKLSWRTASPRSRRAKGWPNEAAAGRWEENLEDAFGKDPAVTQADTAALRLVGQPHGPERPDIARAVCRDDSDSLCDGREFPDGGLCDHRRRHLRRARRTHGPPPQSNLQFWSRARQPFGFHQLRRRSGRRSILV